MCFAYRPAVLVVIYTLLHLLIIKSEVSVTCQCEKNEPQITVGFVTCIHIGDCRCRMLCRVPQTSLKIYNNPSSLPLLKPIACLIRKPHELVSSRTSKGIIGRYLISGPYRCLFPGLLFRRSRFLSQAHAGDNRAQMILNLEA